jgi:hypothetical protein
VHHSGVEDKRPRGTTAIFSNADLVLRVSKDEEQVTVRCDKVRNQAPLEDKHFVLTAATPESLIPVLRPATQVTRRGMALGRAHKQVL